MKVNELNRKLIKPCTSTPENLRIYKVSCTDELSPLMNIAAILYYENTEKVKSDELQESLAKILPQFYPLAGRQIHKDHLVDCSDQGALFVEAQVVDDDGIDLIIGSNDLQLLNEMLLPCQCFEVGEVTDPLLSIQFTRFSKSGVVAVGVSVSHSIVDASSLWTFISALANANNSISLFPSVSFSTPSLFPGKNSINIDPNFNSNPTRTGDPTIIAKRFLFRKEAITSLRAKIQNKQPVSRVRIVSALIAKALIGVDIARQEGKSRPCLIAQAVNMRGRTELIPPPPNNVCGNLVLQALLNIEADKTKDIGFEDLVCLLGDAIDKTIQDCASISSRDDGGEGIIIDPALSTLETIMSGGVNVMWFSDWSKFGFYEADFGWGKPIWASVGTMFSENLVILMNNKEGDGIEAFVHLHENYMPYFEQDVGIKTFCY